MVSSVPKKKAQRRILETLRNEIDLLRSLDHPNIVRAYESYEVGQDLHLVMELCGGGGEWFRIIYYEVLRTAVQEQVVPDTYVLPGVFFFCFLSGNGDVRRRW